MKILFLHGLGSRPRNIKAAFQKQRGHKVIKPSLPDEEFMEAVQVAQAAYENSRPDVVIGAGRGGAVAMNIDSGFTPMVLIAPCWKTWGAAQKVKRNTVILHSENDSSVPIAQSRELLYNSNIPDSELVTVGQDARMIDDEALETLWKTVETETRILIDAPLHQVTVFLDRTAEDVPRILKRIRSVDGVAIAMLEVENLGDTMADN
ncbi:MAG: hypothetical protein N2C14_03480 [Planctomycetales bacterium]